MVKCVAYGCRSGYVTKSEGTVNSDIKVTFHAFPLKNKDLCDKWVRANPRKDFVPTQHSKLCSLHFKPSDFVDERRDSNVQRRKSLDNKLVRRHLREGAVPSIFPNAPKYLQSTNSCTPRVTSKASSSSRREQEAELLDRLEESFRAEDDISELSVEDLKLRLVAELTAPKGFTLTVLDGTLLIYLLNITDDVPTIKACITVRSDRTVVAAVDDKKVPACQFKDLVNGQLKKMSQLINLMARLKSWSEDPSTRSLELHLQLIVQYLKTSLKVSQLDEEQEEYRRIQFIIEQLELIATPKYGRHYSPQLTIYAYMVYAASSSA